MGYAQTLKKLFALSGNVCAFPGCSAPIVDTESGVVVGDICHIKGRSENGPRYDPNQTDEERNGYENLLLMCVAHNRIVDGRKTRDQYPVERLQEFKRDHEAHYGGSVVDEAASNEFLTHFSVAGSVITTYNQSGGQNANTIQNIYTHPPGAEREADEDARAWALYADFYPASCEGYVLKPEIGSEQHRLAERLVAKGMLQRLPPGMGYAIPGQQFVIGTDPQPNLQPARPSGGLRCQLAYHLKQKDDIAGIDYYALEVTACNDGDVTVNDLRVSVEIPREHMEGGETIVAEVDSRDHTMRLFKFPLRDNPHREPPRISLDPEERRFISQLTFTARRKHYLEGTDGRIRVRLLANDRVAACEEKPIAETLSEERLRFYQSQ